MQIYAALGVAVAVIGFMLYSAMKPAKQDPNLIFTLDQVVDNPEQTEEKGKDDYIKELNAAKPFDANLAGTLTGAAFLKLRGIINKRAYSRFVPRKQEMMEERLGYFKTKNMQKYVESIRNSATEYEAIMKEAAADALSFLDISEKNFETSFMECRQNP